MAYLIIEYLLGGKKLNKDLTVGKPDSVVWRFTLPLFISVIFQQMYSIADSVIAGKFAGEDALAAVGASYPITMIFMAIAVGSNIGCSIIISQLFGAKRLREMKTAIYTTLIASTALSIVLTTLGLLFNRGLMQLIQTPENIFGEGALYLKIYIAGFIFVYLYNVVTGVFTSLGDSKTPLYFLIASSLGNIGLDALFVAGFHWGVAGVAWATFIAQGLACIVALLTCWRRVRAVRTAEKADLFSWEMLGKISLVAIPSILQQSFVSVGNIFVQSLVNSFGSSVIAGYSAAIKLNTFTLTSFGTIGNGVSSFTAQNIGAGQGTRVKAGFRAGLKMAMMIGAVFFLIYFGLSRQVLGLFLNSDSELAIDTGVRFLKIVSPFYFVILIKLICDAVLRGSGAMKVFMISTFTDLILRVILAFVLAPVYGSTGIWISWPLGWAVGAILSFTFYKTGKWMGAARI